MNIRKYLKWWNQLNEIDILTLLIGRGPSSNIPQVAEQIPKCRLVTINTGHHLHEFDLEAFTKALESFLVKCAHKKHFFYRRSVFFCID